MRFAPNRSPDKKASNAASGAPIAINGWFRVIDTDGSIGICSSSAVSFQTGCGEANHGCTESCSCKTTPYINASTAANPMKTS